MLLPLETLRLMVWLMRKIFVAIRSMGP